MTSSLIIAICALLAGLDVAFVLAVAWMRPVGSVEHDPVVDELLDDGELRFDAQGERNLACAMLMRLPMERTATKGFESFAASLLRLAGGCVLMALGFEAALRRDAASGTVFAMGLGVALAVGLRSTLKAG